jgi:hypothetical protein
VTTAYPLTWPQGVPQTLPGRHAAAQFKTELPAAIKNVTNSLRRFGETTGKPISAVVISSNYSLGDQNPKEPGVAVWFVWDGRERCIAVDRYPRLAHNLQAIHHILEARITEARHGGLRIVQQTFTGFVALPPPSDAPRSCWQVLDCTPGSSRGRILESHRDKAKLIHPDKGGSADDMAALNAARDEALKAIGESE